MGFVERGHAESLAEHLLRNAEVLGADALQVGRLRYAFRLAQGSNAQKAEGGRIAVEVRDELEDALQRALATVRVRGERMARFNDAGAVRVRNRDGLANLLESRPPSLTPVQGKAGLAYRMAYEATAGGLQSCLGRAGEGGGQGQVGGLVRSAAELHRAFLMARLGQMERAAEAAPDADGREVHVLQMVAGEGATIWELAGGSGAARDAYKAALIRSLDAIATTLRIAGG